MHLENLRLINFKTYVQSRFEFCRDINCILGDNGSGKTNLLDGIYYLSLTKSFFHSSDVQNIRFGCEFFGLKGTFFRDNKSQAVSCKLRNNDKKEISLEDSIYDKNTDHIGTFPVVMIAPNDTDMIRGGSDLRRKFFDGVLSQLDRNYLSDLLKYNRALKQRNSLLKLAAEKNYFDKDLIESYDAIIMETGLKIFRERQSLMSRFHPVFGEWYKTMAGEEEKVEIEYLSDLSDPDFGGRFKSHLEIDRQSRRTMLGIHRDDFDFIIKSKSLRKFGSQGQQKSFLVALKLAQFELIRKEKEVKPILLLDDIFDKLDDKRIMHLMKLVNSHSFGQIFITDARPERTLSVITGLDCEKKMIYLESSINTAAGQSFETET